MMVSECERFIRFKNKVEIDPKSGCWNWIGSFYKNGYGQFWVGDKPTQAHRFHWFHIYGPIQSPLEVLHHCYNKKCVNLNHLSVDTHLQNMRDAAMRGRMRKSPPIPDHMKISIRKVIKRMKGAASQISASRPMRMELRSVLTVGTASQGSAHLILSARSRVRAAAAFIVNDEL